MSDDPLVIGVALLFVGFVLNVSSPHLSPSVNANLGLWGGFFALLGLIIIGIRLMDILSR